MRGLAAPVLTVIGAAVLCGFLAAGVSGPKRWAAAVVLGQLAATWILATITQRSTSTTASLWRRRRHYDLGHLPDMTGAGVEPMATSATAERRVFSEG